MAQQKIHQGMWVRQVLKIKRQKKVRITFIPLNPTQPSLSTLRDYDEGEKGTWTQFFEFEKENGPNIDWGITILRFNANQVSGVASFYPNSGKDPIDRHFQAADPADPGNGAGKPEFNACINGKRSTLGNRFYLPVAFAECMSQLLI